MELQNQESVASIQDNNIVGYWSPSGTTWLVTANATPRPEDEGVFKVPRVPMPYPTQNQYQQMHRFILQQALMGEEAPPDPDSLHEEVMDLWKTMWEMKYNS